MTGASARGVRRAWPRRQTKSHAGTGAKAKAAARSAEAVEALQTRWLLKSERLRLSARAYQHVDDINFLSYPPPCAPS